MTASASASGAWSLARSDCSDVPASRAIALVRVVHERDEARAQLIEDPARVERRRPRDTACAERLHERRDLGGRSADAARRDPRSRRPSAPAASSAIGRRAAGVGGRSRPRAGAAARRAPDRSRCPPPRVVSDEPPRMTKRSPARATTGWSSATRAWARGARAAARPPRRRCARRRPACRDGSGRRCAGRARAAHSRGARPRRGSSASRVHPGPAHERHPARDLGDLDAAERDRGARPGQRAAPPAAPCVSMPRTRSFAVEREEPHRRVARERAAPDGAGDDGAGALHREGAVHGQAEEVRRRRAPGSRRRRRRAPRGGRRGPRR